MVRKASQDPSSKDSRDYARAEERNWEDPGQQLVEIDPITSGVIRGMGRRLGAGSRLSAAMISRDISKGSHPHSSSLASLCPLLFLLQQEQSIKCLAITTKIVS